MATKPKISGSATTSKPMKPKTTPVRFNAGILTGTAGAALVNPLYRAAKGIVNYVGGAAREIRDIPTSVGATVTGQGTKSELRQQLKEAAASVTAGQKGTSVLHKKATGRWSMSRERK